MRQRLLRPGFFKNDVLAGLAPITRLLFAGLWCLADREGRLEDRPMRIKGELFPYENFDVEDAIDSLESAGFIQRYSADGESFIQVLKFSKHQFPHPKEAKSVIPKPPESHRKATGKTTASREKAIASPSGSSGSSVPSGSSGSSGSSVPSGPSGSSVEQPSAPAVAALVPTTVKAKSWSTEAGEDWQEFSGGVASFGRIGKALRPLVEKVMRERGMDEAAAWAAIRPYWRRFCESDERRFGPQAFAENPRRVVEGKKRDPGQEVLDDIKRAGGYDAWRARGYSE